VFFRWTRPDAEAVATSVVLSEVAPTGEPRVLSVQDGPGGWRAPLGMAHDCLRTRLGEGANAFRAVRLAFRKWAEFDLGWARVANPEIPVAVGQLVAVEIHAFGLWSVNVSRIVETVDTDTCFGFVYATTNHHAEEGEERFLLEFDPGDGGVWYHLEAISRPRHPLARIGYPATRALQHRFARESHARMRRVVAEAVRDS
jgi:uncharacterized protein (UPF0548 family)